MIIMPRRSQCRFCRHLRGISQPDGTEKSERFNCAAYPQERIPRELLFNLADHRQPFAGDQGVRFAPQEGEQHPLDASQHPQ